MLYFILIIDYDILYVAHRLLLQNIVLFSCSLHYIIIKMSEQQFQKKKKQKIIGGYSIGKTIGIGTFANVREGIHIRTGEKVSIKILNKNMIEQTRDKINLSREIRILKKIRHPNIAQLLEIMETNNRIYFVMQYVEGGELFTRITSSKKGRLNQEVAAIIFQQLINAIEYLHTIGIAHRDLKPENILLDYQNNVKLIDFGLSSFYQRNQKLKTSCGSPCYAAPEMLVEEEYDPLMSDIWSSGIVLYAMVCGYLPYQEQNTKVLYDKIKIGKYQEPKFLSDTTKDILAKILRFNPQQRISFTGIRYHQFCTPKQPIVKGLFPSQPLKLEQQLILEMNKNGYYGFRNDVQSHKNTSNTAAYYLLLYKMLKSRSESLLDYFTKINQNGLKSNFRSKSMVLKRENIKLNSESSKKLNPLISYRYQSQNNEQESDFLDKLAQKNLNKMRQRSLSIRVRKITS